MKTYILQKDTPVSKAGEKVRKGKSLIFNFEGYRSESGEFFETATVENAPEWFKPEKTKREIDLEAFQSVIDELKHIKKGVFNGNQELVGSISLDIHSPTYECGASNGYREYKRTGEKYITIKINLQEL